MHVNPSVGNQELFHLRMLLLHVRGATSFKYLLTVDGTSYGCFKDACRAQGLYADDGPSYGEMLSEVALHASAWQIRNFFPSLIVYCHLDPIKEHWLNHRIAMPEDYRRRGSSSPLNMARTEVLRLVKEMDADGVSRVAACLTVPCLSPAEEEVLPENECEEEADDVNNGLNTDAEDDGVAAYMATLTVRWSLDQRVYVNFHSFEKNGFLCLNL